MSYQQFVKLHMAMEHIKQLPQKDRMAKIGAMWQQQKQDLVNPARKQHQTEIFLTKTENRLTKTRPKNHFATQWQNRLTKSHPKTHFTAQTEIFRKSQKTN